MEIHEIKVKGIPQKAGVWIVELEGEGISSRAFIQKGSISGLATLNTAGLEVKFYGENGKQIK